MADNDSIGILCDGLVLTGQMTLEQRRLAEVITLLGLGRKKDQEQHESVADYDPVLRWHCRLDQEG